ncbi:MAG: pyridoxal 5'-phosphate synthase glutaminase subunit PdxT [Acidimicrobiales bacterium]
MTETTVAAVSTRRESAMDGMPLVIGVLALQGDVEAHARLLELLDVEVKEVRTPADLDGIDGLVLPGGESTALQLLIEGAELREPIAKALADGLPVLGTCAGMILLAREVLDGRTDQWSFGAIDIGVRRNAFGRQSESFESDLEFRSAENGPIHAVFIRAPFVESVGDDVEVLAEMTMSDGRSRPVGCRSQNVTVVAFHPELVSDPRVHALLVDDARRRVDALKESHE